MTTLLAFLCYGSVCFVFGWMLRAAARQPEEVPGECRRVRALYLEAMGEHARAHNLNRTSGAASKEYKQ